VAVTKGQRLSAEVRSTHLSSPDYVWVGLFDPLCGYVTSNTADVTMNGWGQVPPLLIQAYQPATADGVQEVRLDPVAAVTGSLDFVVRVTTDRTGGGTTT